MVYYPQEPTDWTEDLAKVYDRQSRQLQEHHDNLRARDAREVEVKQQESFVNTLAKIAEFSSAARQLTQSYKAGKQAKDKKQTIEVQNWMVSNPSTSDKLTEIIKDNDLKKKDIWKWFNRPEQRELKLEWEANGEYEKLRELRKIYGTNNIILRQALAVQHGQSLFNSPTWDAYKYKKYGEDLDSISSAELMQTRADFYSEEVMKLGVTKEFATANYASEINKQANVTKNLQQAKHLTLRNKEQVQLVRTLFPIAATSNNTAALGEIFVTEATNRETQFKPIIENGKVVKTSLQQAVDSVYQDLWTLNEEGYIPDISILGDYKFEHPAGTKNAEGENVANVFTALFDKKGDKYNSLIAANNRGKSKLLSAATTIDLVRLGELRTAAVQGKDVSQELQLLKNNGLLSEEQIKSVSDIGIHDNTKESYNEVKESYNKRNILNGGNLVAHEEEIKKEPNIEFRNEQLARIKHHKERRKQLGYPKDDVAFVRSRIAGAFNLTLGEDEKLPGKLHDLQIHLVQKLRKEFQDNIETPDHQPIIDRNSWILANDNFENYIVKNGIDVTSNADVGKTKAKPVEGEGIFSADTSGNLRHWKTFDKQRIDAIREFNRSNDRNFNETIVQESERNLHSEFSIAEKNSETQEGLTVQDRVLNKAESLLTKEDILGFFSQGRVSGEVVYKARRLGIPAKTLIRRQWEALKNNGGYKEYLKLHGLDKIDFPESADETLGRVLADSGNRNLLYNFNRGYTSPNINRRIIKAWNAWMDEQGLPGDTYKYNPWGLNSEQNPTNSSVTTGP